MKTDDFDYALPEELIAQSPSEVRDACKMLVVGRNDGSLQDCIFRDILDFLRPGDLLVANETRVRPARLIGRKEGTGGAAEVFLLRPASSLSFEKCEAVTSIANSQERKISARDFIPNNKCAYWEALVKPGKRLKPGAVVCFYGAGGKQCESDEQCEGDEQINQNSQNGKGNQNFADNDVLMRAEIVDFCAGSGERIVKLSTDLPSLDEALHLVGNTPLPPYIKDYKGDAEMYQTVYARTENSAAAPTAGLHFTPELIARVRKTGIGWETVDLEVGLDTFRVVDESDPTQHKMHTELFSVPNRTVDAIVRTKRAGGRVIAVGTTSVRSLESAAALKETSEEQQRNCSERASEKGSAQTGERAQTINNAPLCACSRQATSLYILPGYKFRVVDGLITNFHVPRSTLLMLVSAFSTRENMMNAYQHAIDEKYRFFSFGDAMFII